MRDSIQEGSSCDRDFCKCAPTAGAGHCSGNNASNGGGIAAHGSAEVMIVDSTISHNGPSDSGGGLYIFDATTTVLNSTLSANSAIRGGAAYGRSHASLILTNATVSDNSATTTGGGIKVKVDSTLTLANTILSGNSGNHPDADVSDTDFSAYNSLLGTSVSPSPSQNNVFNDTPGLGALAYNGGPTQTMALLPASDALNTGDNAKIPAGITFDQRGSNHPRISDGSVDIGAFEHNVDVIFADGFE